MSLGVGCANTHEHVNRIEILMSKCNGRVKRDNADAGLAHIAIGLSVRHGNALFQDHIGTEFVNRRNHGVNIALVAFAGVNEQLTACLDRFLPIGGLDVAGNKLGLKKIGQLARPLLLGQDMETKCLNVAGEALDRIKRVLE